MGHAQTAVLNQATRPERRKHPRYKCDFPVELKLPGIAFASQGHTIDISVGGCYVSTSFNMAIGTELEIKVWVGDKGITTKAIVRTSDPGVGNGMEFLGLSSEGQQALNGHFATLDATPADNSDRPLRDLLII